jgi:hypothetical protein
MTFFIPAMGSSDTMGVHRTAEHQAFPAQAGIHPSAGVALPEVHRRRKHVKSGACGTMGPGLRREDEQEHSQSPRFQRVTRSV